jgi:hypothetical protein
MTRISRAAVLASITFTLGFAADAHAAATVNVACSATKKIQTAINGAAAGSVTTINVTGTCNENLNIPQGKTVIIKGTSASTPAVLRQKDITLPAVLTRGDATLQNFLVQTTGGTADALIQAEGGGIIQLIGDGVTGGTSIDSIVGIWDNSTGFIFNTDVTGGASDAIDISNLGSLVLGSNPSAAQGPSGLQSNIANSVFCGPGSSLFLRVKGSGTGAGKLTITGGNQGVATNQCSVTIWNKTASVDNLIITGTNGPGIALNKSTLSLQNAKITGSGGPGIDALASSATILTSSFIGNGTGDGNLELKAGPGSMLYVQGWAGLNDIPSAFTGQAVECWPYPANGGTSATSGQVVIETSAISVPSGSLPTDLTTNNTCPTYLP